MTVALSQLELDWFGQDWVALGRSSPPDAHQGRSQ